MSLEERGQNSPAREPDGSQFRRPVPVTEVEAPLRLRIVGGYLQFTGVLGLIASGGSLIFRLIGTTGTPSVTKVLSALLMSVSSLYAARALKRREKQGALVALGLLVAPFIYALFGRTDGGRLGIMSILAIVAILSAWKELD